MNTAWPPEGAQVTAAEAMRGHQFPFSTAETARRPLAWASAWEAVTSLGESARESALLLRAGLCNLAPSRFFDARGDAVLLCRAPALDADLPFLDRLAELSRLAIERLAPQLPTLPQALLLAWPARLADEHGRLNDAGCAAVEVLRRLLPRGWERLAIEVFPHGAPAAARALRRALQRLPRDGVLLWGGVDTLHDAGVLAELEADDRLLRPDQVDGMRPGEAAAFVALEARAVEGAVGLLACGFGDDETVAGRSGLDASLTASLTGGLAPLRALGARCNQWLLGSSHEEVATRALQNLIGRCGDVLGTATLLHAPLKELGHVGAATLPLLFALGAEGWRDGHHAEPFSVLVDGLYGGGERSAAALVLQAPDRSSRPPGLAAGDGSPAWMR